MTRKKLIAIARLEMAEWNASVPRGLVMIILFAFIHRVTTGETVEETFLQPTNPAPDYEI